jgi:hypothetical protein
MLQRHEERSVPKTKSEPTKKHGDTLEELIERTGDESQEQGDSQSADDTGQRDVDDEDVEDTEERSN